MNTEVQKIETHLKTNPRWVISIMDADTENFIERKLSLQSITQKYENLDGLFANLLKQGFTKLQVHRKKPNGSSFPTIGAILNLGIGNITENQPLQQTQTPPSLSAPAQQQQMPQPVAQTTQSLTSNLQLHEYLYKSRIQDLEKQITKLEANENKDKAEHQRLKTEINELELKIRNLEAEKAVFEEKKRYELLMKDQQTQSFLESKGFQHLVTEAKSLVPAIMANKMQGSAQHIVPLNNPAFSERKGKLLEYIQLDIVNDHICTLLYNAGVTITESGENFITEFENLLNKYNPNN